MAELVDAQDLKSCEQKCSYGFDSRPEHKLPKLLFMKRWTLLLLSLLSVLTLKAQSYEYGKLICTNGDTLLYRYLTPEKVKSIEKYPLVLYLHTSGERGNDN